MAAPWARVEWWVQDLEDPVVLAPGDQELLYLVQGDLEALAIWALMVQWGWDRDPQVLDHLQVQDRE